MLPAVRIAFLGAGAMGNAAARLAARRPDVDPLVLDFDPARAERVVEAVGRGEARRVDVEGGALEAALKDADAVAACLPYRLNLPVMEAALAARCPYADLGGLYHVTIQQLELDGRFREAGVPAVLGIGMAPGITNLLAASARCPFLAFSIGSAAGVLPQVQAEALLVARVHLPPQRDAFRLPVAQVVAAPGLLDLDHLGAEVGQHRG